ncbi:MAG: GIY-YIG nuclease family protein [Chitinophagaceae bacterium]|nr:GIY-YIG nuclease family protein [Chitinophagaceae bacterium]
MPFYTYILKSLKDQKYYYGYCSDLTKRLDNHNQGKVKSTKHRRPFVLHYFETFDVRADAIRRELFFKSIDGYNFLKSQNII